MIIRQKMSHLIMGILLTPTIQMRILYRTVKLIRFLDAYDYKEKLDILTSMRSELNDGLIDIMAESIEVAVPEGDINDRYNSLRKCLLAHTKYEGLRLRQLVIIVRKLT